MQRRVLNITSFLLVVLLIASLFCACDISSGQKNFLWQVQSENNIVYILGSVHFAKKEMYPLDIAIESSFEISDILVVEADVSQMDQAKIQMSMMMKGIYLEGETLEKKLSKETYELAKKKLSEYRMDIRLLNHNKPWFVALAIAGMEYQKLGFDPNLGIDVHFLGKAKDKKKILELEGIEYQIDLFNNFSDELQELFLFYTLADLDLTKSKLDKLMKAWKSGDTEGMDRLFKEIILEYPKLSPVFEKLIYQRNQEMTSKIEEYLKGYQIYFVIVGAGHLVGEKGIIELLKEKGYSVEQI